MSGWLLPLIELTPRIVMLDDEPGTPEELVTSTPATRPASALMKFSRPVCASSAPETVCWALPSSRLAAVWPSAVTTMASRLAADFSSATSMMLAAPTSCSFGTYPISRNCSVWPTRALMV